MPAKRPKAKLQKTAARPSQKTERKAKTLKPEFSAEEVVLFEHVLARHQQSESAWQKLTATTEDDDRWGEVEEHLLSKGQRQEHSERRWKYFAK